MRGWRQGCGGEQEVRGQDAARLEADTEVCRLCVWLGRDRCGVAAAFYSVLSGGREEGVAQRRWRLYSGSRISLILGPFRQLQFGAGLPGGGGWGGWGKGR